MFSKEKDKASINAIYQDDVEKLLAKFGLEEKFRNGTLKCKYCAEPISKDNIYSIMPVSGNVSIVCDKPTCIDSFMEKLNDNK